MNKGIYTAVLFSFVIHGLILALIILTQATKPKTVQPNTKNIAIESYIYYAPKIAKAPKNQSDEKAIADTVKNNEQEKSTTPVTKTIKHNPQLEHVSLATPPLDTSSTEVTATLPAKPPQVDVTKVPSLPTPKPTHQKLDSFTQLQRLRSKLNTAATIGTDNPYQKYQPPSVFNKTVKSVPHSVPLKDEEKEREKRTKNMGSGTAINKGEDGNCSITQDLSVYGLSEGSSKQYFSCGESKFDKSFRVHMKKVKAKLGKN